MRRALAVTAAVVVAAGCTRAFDNPLDGAGDFRLALTKFEQVGIHRANVDFTPTPLASVTGYRLRCRSEHAAAVSSDVTSHRSSFAVDLVAGATYACTVVALAGAKESAPSKPLSVTLQPTTLDAPTLVQTGIGALRATAGAMPAWISKASVVATPAEGEAIEALLPADGGPAELAVDEGVAYDVTVRASDPYGGQASSPATTTTLNTPPPQYFRVTRPVIAPDTAVASWEGVDGAAGYRLEVTTDGTWAPALPADVPLPTATVTGLAPDVAYTFQVRAVGTNGKTTAPSGYAYKPPVQWSLDDPGFASAPLPGPQATALGANVATDPVSQRTVVHVAYSDPTDDRLRVFELRADPLGAWTEVANVPLAPPPSVALQAEFVDADDWLFVPFPAQSLPDDPLGLLRVVDGAAFDVRSFDVNPPWRRDASASFVSDGDPATLAVFGGTLANGTPTNELWTFTVGSTQAHATLFTTSNAPSPRANAAQVSTSDGTVYVFGGDTGGAGDPALYSALPPSGSAWTTVDDGVGVTPRTRVHGGFIASADGASLYLLGGWAMDGGALPTTELDTFHVGGGWSKDVLTGSGPAPGTVALAPAPFGDDGTLFAFDGTGAFLVTPDDHAWTRIDPPVPARRGFATTYDTSADRLLIFGGVDPSASSPAPTNELWQLEPHSHLPWRRIDATNAPAPRSDASLAWDDDDETLFLFGGDAGDSTLHELAPSALPGWTDVVRAGAPTPKSDDLLAIDDSESDGGRSAWIVSVDGSLHSTTLDDVATTWTDHAPSTTPTFSPVNCRQRASCFDSQTNTAYVVGVDGTSVAVWKTKLDQHAFWSRIDTSLPPSGCVLPHQLACAPDEHALYLHLGDAGGGSFWRLEVEESAGVFPWQQLSVPGDSPGARTGGTLSYDGEADGSSAELLLFGGADAGGQLTSSAWGLDIR